MVRREMRAPATVALAAVVQYLLVSLGLPVAALSQTLPPRPQTLGTEEQSLRQAKIWAKEGLSLYASGKYWSAAQTFEKLYALYPDNPDVAFDYGQALQGLGEFERAIEPLRKALVARPDDSEARLSLGVCYLGVGRLEEGVRELEGSLAGNPSNNRTLFYLAVAYHSLRRDADANQQLRWMVERNPNSALTFLYIARALRMVANYAEAEKAIHKALELDPKASEAHFERGFILRGMGHSAEAEKSLLEALRLQPEKPSTNLALGELYLADRHDADAAIPYFQRAIQFNPSDARAHLDLGKAYLRKGDSAAENSLRHAIELRPGFRQAHYLLGTILQRQRRKDEAAQEFSIAEKLGAVEHQPRIDAFQALGEDKVD